MVITNPLGPINYGRDFNFYQKLSVSSSSFNTNADVVITFTTSTVNFALESTGVVQYSFNGSTLHGELDSSQASKTLTFPNRVISKIWFKLVSGTGTVRIEAWSIP